MPCDLSCKTKIIINGDNVVHMLETLCEQVEYARDHDIEISGNLGLAVIKVLNDMEDMAGKAQALFLKGIGYDGPLPKALS